MTPVIPFFFFFSAKKTRTKSRRFFGAKAPHHCGRVGCLGVDRDRTRGHQQSVPVTNANSLLLAPRDGLATVRHGCGRVVGLLYYIIQKMCLPQKSGIPYYL